MASPSLLALPLKRLCHVGPITAMSFTPDNSHLLYSSGPILHCHSVLEEKEVSKAEVFERNRIHGIRVEALPDEVQVLLWGGSSFAIVPLKQILSPNCSLKRAEVIASDWLLDAQLIDSNTAALVTAHNSVLIYSLREKKFVNQFNCEEQSLLYAAQLYLAGGEILVASGTVFNEIQLWELSASSIDSSSQNTTSVAIAKRLRGHEGCVFSLRFNAEGSLLASCSDDRTIRLWDVQKGGFLAIGFAHIARVWDVQFVPNSGSQEIYLLSASEDTTALLWHFNPSQRTLKVQERYHGHSGKHVWTEAISSDGKLGATGGNDGRVNLWNIDTWKERFGLETSDICWIEQTPKAVVDGKEFFDVIKGYKCIDENRLLVTTNSGYISYCSSKPDIRCIWLYNLDQRAWDLVSREEKYQRYAVVGSFEGLQDLVILGDSKGNAKIFNVNNYENSSEWSASRDLIVTFYTTVSQTNLFVLSQGAHNTLSTISKDSSGFSLVSNNSMQLPNGFAITSFLADADRGIFFLGSRQGALACYELATCRMIGVWRRIHDEESVRSIRLHGVQTQRYSTEIMTTGRDSVYKILKINIPDKFEGSLPVDVVDGYFEGVEMQVMHRTLLNRGWLEGSALLGGNLLLWGFHSKNFSFWNETTGELIFERQSGGANRIWDFYLPSRPNLNLHNAIKGSWFVYTSKGELHFQRVGQTIIQRCVNRGNHGREIRSMALRRADDGTLMLASGSEDTYINLTKVVNDRLEYIGRKKQFKTGVQSLVFSSDGKFLFSSAGQREMSITPIRLDNENILSVEFGGFSNSMNSNDNEELRDEDEGGDLRIMALDIRDQVIRDRKGYLIALAMSNSTVKLYWLDYETKQSTPVLSGRYSSRCLLQCKFLPGCDVLVVAATDGHVIFYRIPTLNGPKLEQEWLYSTKAHFHQSGVRAMGITRETDTEFRIITGGDDTAIHLAEVTITSTIVCRSLATGSGGHASTITGVISLGNSSYLSVGVDQKLLLWRYENGSLLHLLSGYTFVPDVCGILDLGIFGVKRKIVAYGSGMELIELQM